MNVIGGYFELELNNNGTVYHDKAIALNTGRNAFEYILLNKNYKKVYIPYYTCDVILEPLKKLEIQYEFYHIDEYFLPKMKPQNENEALLYVNYFGILNKNVSKVVSAYKNVIIDNSQAFFAMPIVNTSTFYSPRKFFGLPDGGFAYVYDKKDNFLEIESDKSLDRISHLVQRIENGAEAGYESFISDNIKLHNYPLSLMSNLTQKLMKNIDFEYIRSVRNKNYEFVHKSLKGLNEMTPILNKEPINGPMVYPFLLKDNFKLKKELIQNKVFVATYWPNVKVWLEGNNFFEAYLQDNLIPIPIDQRYNYDDLLIVINIIENFKTNYKLANKT